MQQLSNEEQQFYGQMWITHVDRESDGFGLESRQHSMFANQAAEATQRWTSASHKYQLAQSCSSVCSSTSTVSASTSSSAPSISSSSTFGSTPCFDLRGYHSFATDSASELNDRQSDSAMPSTFWVEPCQWDSVQSNAAEFSSFAAGMPSTSWVGPCPWESPSEEIELEEYSLGSGYKESNNVYR
jgi:hypothetical protein